ncbi:MAG: RsmB/NOP family class I SAM-dependent RNA methyltransferase, partial [Fretibacterium sp.]|nr:RsmB/NOP family class I SAM-dependent RNA methyltransferase [Fretibacterium sp.]
MSVRGIEGALHVLKAAREGRFASEVLRGLGERLEPPDLTLASTLAYAALRRLELWQALYEGFLRDGGKKGGKGREVRKGPGLPSEVVDCLTLGTAGLLELRHFAVGPLVNGLLDLLKASGKARFVPLANAVLRRVGEEGAARAEAFRRSPKLEERCLWGGVPVWSLPAWSKTWKRPELLELFELMRLPPASSLRVLPAEREAMLRELSAAGLEAVPSPDLPGGIRLPSTALPTALPGFDSGRVTAQSEGSMRVASLVAEQWRGGLILDLCAGRGVKTGQIAQTLPEARIEGWELSRGRHAAARREMERLKLSGRVRLRLGDSLQLTPPEPPTLILLDAPCSGSGTWNRKPESKWRLNWRTFDNLVALQRRLLQRALDIAAPGGI